jgi:Tol biopolymer transport system component
MRYRIALILPLLLIACSTFDASSTPSHPSAAPPPTTGSEPSPSLVPSVPHVEKWGIYRLDFDTQHVELVFSSPSEISFLHLSNAGDRFAFSQKVGGDANTSEEIFTLSADGRDLNRVTDNAFWDLYPAWSPDDARIAFLSQRSDTLGIFVMNSDGSDQAELLDSDAHEADIDWVQDRIAFTRESRIWTMNADGSDARPLTDPPKAGEWGDANLPFGDYDPRISPDGSRVIFERLLSDESSHGNYDLFVIDTATSEEDRLTHSGYSQGLASWSHSGKQLVYVVAAIDDAGQYDLYMMNADGSDNRNVTPDYFPPQFLCHGAVFSNDDSSIFFVGEWWSAQ